METGPKPFVLLMALAVLVVLGGAVVAAGYGLLAALAVGVPLAVLVALALGLAVGLLVGMLLGQRPTMGRISLESPEQERMTAMARAMEEVEGVERGELRAIIPVGSRAEANGIGLELLTIEIREAGGIGFLALSGRLSRVDPIVGLDLVIRDDVGTAYAAGGMSGSSHVGTSRRVDFRFAPAPPAEAQQLSIEIRSLQRMEFDRGALARIDGPWRFDVALPARRRDD